ncbi:MAG: D-aminoacylase [Gemmatimonadota bacterium]|nr:D-aminoacylase [Gemmatimonadota bacterium]
MSSRRTFLFQSAVLAGSLAGLKSNPLSAQDPSKTLLTGALVFDGTGAPGRMVDVLLEGDRIVETGVRLPRTGARIIDLGGWAVAPGFIDIHSHTDRSLLVDPRAESKVRQGVTTEVAGQDGGSVGPWSDEDFEFERESYRSRYDVEVDYRDLPGFFARLERTPGAVNFASMIGAGTVRGFVVGADDRPATDEEIARMIHEVERALAAGACGVSSGLEYIPGAFADSKELAALAAPLRGTGLPYASHMRNEDDRLFGAVEEAILVGTMAGVPVQISHLKAQGERNWWKGNAVLNSIERASRAGVDVTFDRYPYVAYSTGLSSMFPVWSRDGGGDRFLERLQTPELQERIEADVRAKVRLLGSWNAVQITSTSSDSLAWARGRKLGDLAEERGEEPYSFLRWLMLEDRARPGMVGFGMSEENTEQILAHPLGMVCSDGGARAVDGPLSEGSPHPRSYGSFPRVLGYYVRERNIVPLETAIHKMTGMPARKLGFQDRGVLAAGAIADIVVFDPDTVADTATFEQPHRYPVGIPHVMVNGTFVIWEGENTGARPGRVVRPAASSQGG